MAIIRERRRAAIGAIYARAALAHLLIALIVTAISFLPGVLLPARAPMATAQAFGIMILLIMIATLVIWRAFRKLTILLLLWVLYQIATYVLNGLGTHFQFTSEHSLPEGSSYTDTAALQALFNSEMGTDTPFYETIPFLTREPINLAEALSGLPVLGGLLGPLGSFGIQPAYLAYVNAVLLVVLAVIMFRTIRHRP